LQGPEKLPEMAQKMWPVHCVDGTWGWKLHKDLKLADEDSFVKKGTDSKIDSYSAFYDNAKLSKTNLHDILRGAGVKDIYLCGLAWDYCVAFTALEGRELGYNVWVVSDGCKGVDNEGIKMMNERMRQAGVKFISSQELEKNLEEKEHNNDNNHCYNGAEASSWRRAASSPAVDEGRERGTLSSN
jgi:nicotinamidase-related amidase